MTDDFTPPPEEPIQPEEPNQPDKEQDLIAHVRSQLADLDRLGEGHMPLQAQNFPLHCYAPQLCQRAWLPTASTCSTCRTEADDSTIRRFIRATNGNLPLVSLMAA
jgi:hypothetical protein